MDMQHLCISEDLACECTNLSWNQEVRQITRDIIQLVSLGDRGRTSTAYKAYTFKADPFPCLTHVGHKDIT